MAQRVWQRVDVYETSAPPQPTRAAAAQEVFARESDRRSRHAPRKRADFRRECARHDSNMRPLPPQGSALSPELRARGFVSVAALAPASAAAADMRGCGPPTSM